METECAEVDAAGECIHKERPPPVIALLRTPSTQAPQLSRASMRR